MTQATTPITRVAKHPDVEMGIRRNISSSGQVNNSCCGVKAIGRFFYISSGTTLTVESVVAIGAGVSSKYVSHPWVSYTVATIAGSLAILEVFKIAFTRELVPKMEYEQNVNRMNDEMQQMDGNVDKIEKSEKELSETSARYKETHANLEAKIKAGEETIKKLLAEKESFRAIVEESNRKNAEATAAVISELQELRPLYELYKKSAIELGRLLAEMIRRNVELAQGNKELQAIVSKLRDAGKQIHQRSNELGSNVNGFQQENQIFSGYVAALTQAVAANDEFIEKEKALWDQVQQKLQQEDQVIVQLHAKNEESEKRMTNQIEQIRQLLNELATLLPPQIQPLLAKLASMEKDKDRVKS